jgi:GPH family glycoside/pentoside/hexuronide:cation symporter
MRVHKRLAGETTPGIPLTAKTMVAFSLPALVSAIMHGPAASILPGILAVHYGVDLVAIGSILLIVRLFDAVTDPMIGFLSDNTRGRYGRRKPWVVGGYFVALFGLYFLYVPTGVPTPFYIGFWFMVLYLGWTMAEIPINAWMLELNRDAGERAKLAGYRAVVAAVGGLAFTLIPLLPIFETTEFTPQVLKFVAWICIFTLPVAVAIQVRVVPEGPRISTVGNGSIIQLAKEIVKNKPLLWFVGIQILAAMTLGMQIAGWFIWVDSYLLIGDKLPFILAFTTVVVLVATPLSIPLVRRFNHIRSLIAISLFSNVALALAYFIDPGPLAFPLLTALLLIVFVGNSVYSVAGRHSWGISWITTSFAPEKTSPAGTHQLWCWQRSRSSLWEVPWCIFSWRHSV